MKKLLIIGVTGLVGTEISKQLKAKYQIYGISRTPIDTPDYTHISFDIEKDNMSEILSEVKPDLIISCTRGDFERQLLCHKKISEYCSVNEIRLYYFSTANVFDGCPDGVKFETDTPCSDSPYGKFKINCEELIKGVMGEKAIIIRLPMVFGENALRVNQIRDAIMNQEQIKVYDNLIITTITDIALVKQLRFIIENELTGVFHLASLDEVNQVDFYKKSIGSDDIIEISHIDEVETYYLAIKSNRDELKQFKFTCGEMIDLIRGYISNWRI